MWSMLKMKPPIHRALLIATALSLLAQRPPAALAQGHDDRAPQDLPGAPESLEAWRQENHCGLNCIYFILKYKKIKNINYDDIKSRVGINNSGTSFKKMYDVLGFYGLGARIVESNLEGLERCPKPVIAHTEPESSAEFSASTRGHFCVLLDVKKDNVTYIDGTTGMMVSKQTPKFLREWSGYLLVLDDPSSIRRRTLILGSMVALVIFWSCYLYSYLIRRKLGPVKV